MALNFSSICRLCMGKKGTLLSLFNDKKGQMISAKIVNFVPVVKVISGDGLPAQVCRQCVRLVNSSYKFKQQCESSDTTLRQYLNNQSYQENKNEILHSVFRTDDDEECWKLTVVKNEVSVEDASLDTPTERDDSNDEYEDRRESDGYTEQSEWKDPQAGISSEENKETKEASKKQKKVNISSKKRLKGKKSGKKWSLYKSVNDERNVKAENNELNESESFDRVTDTSANDPLVDIKIEPFEIKVKVPKIKEKKSFLCHDCGKNFARKQHLLLHLRTHTGEKPFSCKECGESFGMSSNLNKHMRIHTGERPFLCTMCGKCFGRSDTLTKHMRCHTGEKPFHCTVCGNNFGRSSTLINHMRTHLGEKPYLCTECGRRFVQSYDLTKHMRSHTGEKPYRCTVCRMSFGQKNSLNKHMRSHTGHVGEIPFPPMEFQRAIPYVHYRPSVADLSMERNAVFLGSGSQLQ